MASVERAFITMTLAVDLDMIPGACNKPEDFVELIKQHLKGVQHYKPELSVFDTVVIPYVWNEEKGEYIQPGLTDAPFRYYPFYAWERLHPEEFWESEDSFMDRIVWC